MKSLKETERLFLENPEIMEKAGITSDTNRMFFVSNINKRHLKELGIEGNEVETFFNNLVKLGYYESVRNKNQKSSLESGKIFDRSEMYYRRTDKDLKIRN